MLPVILAIANIRRSIMTTYSHQTAPTQFVEANGIRFAYRRFGNHRGVPTVFNLHYLGTMDYWDPAVTDGLARDREVILFNNASVSSRSGEVPTTFEPMGANAIAFIKALGLSKVDVLGFSIGGMGRAGNHAAGARSRPQGNPRGYGPAWRPGNGVTDPGSEADLRRCL
jgi:hypothetical protein